MDGRRGGHQVGVENEITNLALERTKPPAPVALAEDKSVDSRCAEPIKPSSLPRRSSAFWATVVAVLKPLPRPLCLPAAPASCSILRTHVGLMMRKEGQVPCPPLSPQGAKCKPRENKRGREEEARGRACTGEMASACGQRWDWGVPAEVAWRCRTGLLPAFSPKHPVGPCGYIYLVATLSIPPPHHSQIKETWILTDRSKS